MINKKEEISIYNYLISNDILLYTQRQGSDIRLFEYPSRGSILVNGVAGGLNYFKNGNSIIVNDLNDNRYVEIVSGNESISNQGCSTQIGEGKYYILTYSEQENKILLDSNFNKLRSLANFPENFYQSIFYDDCLYAVVDNLEHSPKKPRSMLVKYDIENDSIEKIFDAKECIWLNEDGIEEVGFIRQLICGIDDSLIFEVSKYHIICIDLNSGKKLWEISDFISNAEQTKYLSYGVSPSSRTPMKWMKDEKNNKLHLLARHFYWNLDIMSRKVSMVSDFLDSTLMNRWSIQNTNLVGNEILFTGTQGFQSTPNRIGAYDIDSKSIVWEYELKSGYFRGAPELIDGHLVVSDSNSILHVFTKDDQEA